MSIAALAATPTALYYAMAGVPISIMVLVFSAPDLVGEHLNTLASISLLLQSPTLRRRLEQPPTLPPRCASCAARTDRESERSADDRRRTVNAERDVGPPSTATLPRLIPEKDGARWPSRSSKPRGPA